MTTTALNRALLARQGLLQRLDLPLVDAVEAVGALQAQYWPAPPAALWSRVEGFDPEALYAALKDGELVAGTLLRATLHLVSAREHPAYAAVSAETAGHHWRRTTSSSALSPFGAPRGRGAASSALGAFAPQALSAGTRTRADQRWNGRHLSARWRSSSAGESALGWSASHSSTKAPISSALRGVRLA